MPSIDTNAVEISSGGLIQNLGPDTLYIGTADDVDDTNGFPLYANGIVAVSQANGKLYAVSEGTSDVRTLPRASGVFSIQPPA